MRNYQSKEIFDRAVKTLMSQGVSFSERPLGAGKTQRVVNVPKAATLSLRLWGFVNYLQSEGNYALTRS